MTICVAIAASSIPTATHTNNSSKTHIKKSIQVLASSCIIVDSLHCRSTLEVGAIVYMLDFKPLGRG